MELDDLKKSWEARDRKLDAFLHLNRRLAASTTLDRAASRLSRLSKLLWGEIALDGALLIWIGSFAADHLHDPRYLIPAALLHAGAVALLAVCARQLVALKSVDLGAPIVEVQKRLEALRATRIRAVKWTFLLSPMAWPLLLVVTPKALLGVDSYLFLGSHWLAANVAFGLIAIPVGYFVSKHLAGRMQGSPRFQEFVGDLGGQNLKSALGFLESLRRFEAEESVV